jgi:nucleoside triphosphate pyrophosphatase
MTAVDELAPAAALVDIAASLILASGSETRASMLRAAGLRITIERPAVDEEATKLSLRAAKASASAIAETLAELKAQRVSARHADSHVIGADQVLDCGGESFDKPETVAEALEQLKRLRGKQHQLISAVVVVKGRQTLWHHVDSATLTMRPCSDEFLRRYVKAMGDAVLSSVGGYQIEGLGAQLFSATRGDHFTILGLPLLPLLAFLRDTGILRE